MTNLYQAQVMINGYIIAGEWDGSELVALDGLAITWGRESVYDDAVPSTLSVSILDPDGDWASNNAIVGEQVLISRLTPDTPMFVGRIGDVSLRYEHVTNPSTFEQVPVWIADITCTDVLTDLDQFIVSNPNLTDPGGNTAIAIAGLNINQRVTQLFSAGVGAIVSSIQAAITAQGAASFPPDVQAHPVSDQLSALEILTKYYNTLPFSHVNYNPSTNGVEIGGMASNDGLALILVSGVIKLSPTDALTIDAAEVMRDSLELASPVASQVDQVQVNYIIDMSATGGAINASAAAIRNSARSNPTTKGQRVYSPDVDWQEHVINTPDDLFTGAEADAIIAIVNVLNGQFHVSGLQYDYRRFGALGTAIDAVLLDTKSQAQALYFVRSVLNRLRNCGPMFQLIGGKLTWFNKVVGSSLDAGWVVDMKLAPTTGAILTVLFSALSSNATARIMDFDPELTLNDISHVTTGLS